MLYRCADVFWSSLGPARLCDHGKGDTCLKSKMATSKLYVFVSFLLENMEFYHKYCWNLSQIMLNMSNRGLYLHYSRQEGITVSINLEFNT